MPSEYPKLTEVKERIRKILETTDWQRLAESKRKRPTPRWKARRYARKIGAALAETKTDAKDIRGEGRDWKMTAAGDVDTPSEIRIA
jgi:hypothetical protein